MFLDEVNLRYVRLEPGLAEGVGEGRVRGLLHGAWAVAGLLVGPLILVSLRAG